MNGILYKKINYFQVSPSYSVPGGNTNLAPSALTTTPNRKYVRVYRGWEERVQDCCRNRSNSIYSQTVRSGSGVINSNFQRQDWFRQRSQLKRLNSGGIPTDSTGARSASQESLLGSHSKEPCETTTGRQMMCKERKFQHLPPVHLDPLPDEKKSAERRGRLRQRELAHKTAAQRSKSLPPLEEHTRHDSVDQKWYSPTNGENWNRSGYDETNYSCKVPDVVVTRTKKDGHSVHKSINSNRNHVRDDLKKLENTLPPLQKSRTIEIPPPYRPPPTVGTTSLNTRAPITTYHLRKALSRRIIIDQDDHQEESYV